jgi:ferritin
MQFLEFKGEQIKKFKRKKKKKWIKERKKETNEKKKKIYEYVKKSELPGSLKCIRKFKASRLKDPYSFSNHVESDNKDFLCA